MRCARFSPYARKSLADRGASTITPVLLGGLPTLLFFAGLASYTYATTQIRATIARFYMMTQTLLSAATKAKRGEPCEPARLTWQRHSCLCAVPMWQSLQPWLPHRIATLKHQEEAQAHIPRHKFLIANLELEFKLSPIKINELKFSNRKFLAIFYNTFQPYSTQQPALTVSSSSIQPLVSSCQNPRPPWRLIETPRLEIPVISTKQNQSQSLIETKQPLCAATTQAQPPQPPSDSFRLYARVKNPK
jgi:hypothetical protein